MNRPQNQRRGVAIGVSVLTGLGFATLGVVGVAAHGDSAAQQQDIMLAAIDNAADVAHTNLIDAQVAQDHSLFDNDVALEQSIYYYALRDTDNGGLGLTSAQLYPGDPDDPADSIFNGAFSRVTEGMLVGQALQQAQWDHLLGVNQTLGTGGYETAIANVLTSDLGGADPDSTIGKALDAVTTAAASGSYSQFDAALSTLENDLYQNAFSDVLGIFSTSAGDTGAAAADAAGAVDLPL